MSFFRTATWDGLKQKGIARTQLFAGQHTRSRPVLMRAIFNEGVSGVRATGKQERARRIRQIERGQLRQDNGLI